MSYNISTAIMDIKKIESREKSLRDAITLLEGGDNHESALILKNALDQFDYEKLSIENAFVIPIDVEFIKEWKENHFAEFDLQEYIEKYYADFLENKEKPKYKTFSMNMQVEKGEIYLYNGKPYKWTGDDCVCSWLPDTGIWQWQKV